ncbi:MAG TPA: glycosyltransferase family 1 protein [Gemmatales bacterium]|nr:glycosyltransferase family 1 protein [Gemmatales bacterium]HMP61148.1 glycosyltransferase family 1 protein [Gemmatales bacterium]
MRLTLVTETFAPEINGVARTLERWVNEFERRGCAVQLIRPRRADVPASLRSDVAGFPVPFYPAVYVGWAWPGALVRHFRRFRTDLVHIATEGPLGFAALWAARLLRLPVVSSFHTNFDVYLSHYGLGLLTHLLRSYLRWFHNRTALTLVPSMATREHLRQQGLRRVELWSRGVDAERFHPSRRSEHLRSRLGLGPDDVLLLYVGRLAAEKNLDVLLEAVQSLVSKANPPVGTGRIHLALVGSGPLADTLAAQAHPHVHLAGAKIGLELAEWFASADLFVFPSRTETFGNAILEAQASGLPVIAFGSDVVAERMQHGHDGWLIPWHNRPRAVTDLAAALRELILDAGLRRRLGQAARITAERQSWGPIFDRLQARYEELCRPRRRRFALPAWHRPRPARRRAPTWLTEVVS